MRKVTDLLGLHESVADMFASQGEWRRAYEHLRAALDSAREENLRDALTGAYNRRYLDQRLRTTSGEVAIALVDLDLFKRVNDTFGHLTGDRVLQQVVALLQRDLPHDAFCARYGGEEFALILPCPGAEAVVDAARTRVARHPWFRLTTGLSVTVSIGIARDLSDADELLYVAKRAGRNRVAYRVQGEIRLIHDSV
ncbi:GGDEF domain-containing protein [Amycolatopsis minnesotensis]|uniref:GGDEF domain-containing protein n=1 Tax=Amycolatopsis minnesotensis TaxID=337894 RepID=A0ABP5E9L4_9PSEU